MPDLAHFSGVGFYRRTLEVEPQWLSKGRKVLLDLGDVHDMAIVTINGHRLRPLIARPFRLDVTQVLRPGANTLTVEIANTPENAMIDPKLSGYKLLKPAVAGLVGPVAIEVTR